MTKDEFEQKYADESATPLQRLKDLGMSAQPCACGSPVCKGWQMTSEHEKRIGKVLVGAHAGEPR